MDWLNVDADAIGKGLYRLICVKGDKQIVAFGMIPSWVVKSMRPMLHEKIVSERARVGLEPLTIQETVRLVAQIEHQVVLGIYKAASDAGDMRV